MSEIRKKGDKKMRVAKKLGAVVAMAAVCLTMVAPTTASAATCPPHYFSVYDTDKVVTTTTHEYVYGIIKYPDGSEEEDRRTCVITTTKYYNNAVCLNCSAKERYVDESKTSHSHSANCGQN